MAPKKLYKKKSKKKPVIQGQNLKPLDEVEEEFKGPLSVEHFFRPDEFNTVDLEEEEKEIRQIVVDGEIESMQNILTDQELKIITDKALFPEQAKEGEDFSHLLILSLVPQSNVKFVI